ncbi:hypothetical protein TNIN_339661 [Trichonephila inaurata madagascariensis]|uniref:Uncharacterized protein n=1 Tax=Trichonephila inaurata madagascariensis TaxID=2747483 RepID=A0A8X7C2X4_9ARAC|nr:hypothetical protein TNIN_339661 [Trichonephila inaurata madagascariensis]
MGALETEGWRPPQGHVSHLVEDGGDVMKCETMRALSFGQDCARWYAQSISHRCLKSHCRATVRPRAGITRAPKCRCTRRPLHPELSVVPRRPSPSRQ